MVKTEKGYRFECSGREVDTFGFDGFSIFDNIVGVGKDCYPEFFDHETRKYSTEFSDNEKTELALHMIAQWTNFGLLTPV